MLCSYTFSLKAFIDGGLAKMFLHDLNKTTLTADDIQFALAIVLDGLQELVAAKSVLNFMSPQVKLTCPAYPANRDAWRAKIASYDCDIVHAVIRYFMQNAVFINKVSNNRVTGGSSYVTLGSLLVVAQEDVLYKNIMHIFVRYSVNNLIMLYTKTKMFRIEFINFVRKDCKQTNKKSGVNYISDSTFDLLLEGFTNFVAGNCSNGTYQTSSCSPNPFLFKRKKDDGTSSGPIAWYQMKKDYDYYDILNSHGTNSKMGSSDNFTFLDTVSIDTNSNDKTINFIGLCTKINNASRLLFSHGSDDEAYFDIFSYHRNKNLKKLQNQINRLNLVGCTINCMDVRPLACYDNQTLSNKYNCRSKICDVFTKVLEQGIQKCDVRLLYQEVISTMEIECSGPSGTKDAKSLFSFKGYKSREPGSNGQKFITLLYGYIAMKELISYIESNGSSLGVSVNDFPIDIFRIKGMLNRVRSFEEYIKYGDEIKKLYKEVISDKERSREVVNGIYSNDWVYNYLSGIRVLQNDVTLQVLLKSPIAFLETAVNKYSSFSDGDSMLLSQAKSVYWNWVNTLNSFNILRKFIEFKKIPDLLEIHNLSEMPQNVLNVASVVLANVLIAKAVKNKNSIKHQADTYVLIALFSTILRAASLKEGDKPVHNDAGRYLVKDENLTSSVYFPSSFVNFLGNERARLHLQRRALAIRICMWVMWGQPDEYSTLTSLNAKWEDYWHFWVVTTKLARFFIMDSSAIYEVCCNDDIHQMLIIATSHLNIMDFMQTESGWKLDMLNTIQDPKFFVSKNDVTGYKEFLALGHKRCMLVFSNLLKILKKQTEVFSSIAQRTNIVFSSLAGYVREESDEDRLLEEYVDTMEAYVMSGDYNAAAVQKLAIMADFDEYGYVRAGLYRYRYNSKFYVHKTGFMVSVDTLNRCCNIESINSAVMANLEYFLV